jgi:uncharacterized protein (TIGR03086 family)
MTMDPIENFERAVDIAHAVMQKVTAADLDKPTPCPEWTVRALANHMVGGCLLFSRAARGEAITERPAPTDLLGEDPAAAYGQAAEAATESWNEAGALERTLTIPAGQLPGNVAIGIHTTDQLLHACDLAHALGHDLKVPEDLAETTLIFMQRFITPERRGPGRPFAEAVSVPDDASVQHQLVAFGGRQY